MIDVETIASKWANVYELALPADLEGGYDAANNRILISDRLTPIQRRCVLAHEISHARHHDVGCKCDSATERRADMEAARQAQQQAEQQQAQQQQQANTYYPNCTAAKAAGAAPLYRGQPGYSTKLDRDGDGVACEK